MKRLTQSAYEKAVGYLKRVARPLELARYAYHFEDGSTAEVLAALEAFQNDDGGFGHGLEADVRLADSSVIATTLAFQIFRELGTPGDHALVSNACRYLLNTYDASHLNWPIIPQNVDDAPHAPWWTTSGDLYKSMVNPRVEIAGYLNSYPEHFPAAMREQMTESVIEYLFEQPVKMEMHDLLCYIRLWETKSLAQDIRSKMLDKLKAGVESLVQRDPASWHSYGLQPLWVASTPESPFADDMREAIEQNLDFVIDSQDENGGWMPNWSWGEQWPEAWAQAEREWSGNMTLGKLQTLHAFGRIDV
ncbi:MAG: hypothetical protein R3E39_08455 [Anaerolineae bacterium]